MPYPIFNPDLDQGRTAFMGYTWRDDQEVKTWPRGTPGGFQSVVLEDLSRRVYEWPAGLTELERVTWEGFIRDLAITAWPFLLRDPKDAPREDIPLEPATGDGALVTFSLPTGSSDEESRWYPSPGTVVGKVAGAPVSVASVDQDARLVTFTAPPGLGLAVTADYVGLRLVRITTAPTSTGVDPEWTRYQLALEEVYRDA